LIDFPLPSFLSAGIFGGSTAKEKTLNFASSAFLAKWAVKEIYIK